MEGTLEVVIERRGDVPIVRARGEIDIATASMLSSALEQLGTGERRVIVDLSEVTFVDSSGLGVLIAARSADGEERVVEVVTEHPQVVKVFKVTNLDSIFPIHATLDEALAP